MKKMFITIKRKITKLFPLFINSPKVFSPPKKCDVVIFDQQGSEAIIQYLAGYKSEILAIRGESLNIFCLLRSIFSVNFWNGKILHAYSISYLKYAKPKLCITFIDNNLIFYNINNQIEGITTLMIQNGWRDDWLQCYKDKKFFSVDYMLVFNKWVGNYYADHIKGSVTCIGSLKNNAIKRCDKSLKDSVVYISTFVAVKPGQHTLEVNGVEVLYEDFIKSEIIVLQQLNGWCKANNKVFKVAGCILGGSLEEKAFYEKLLGDMDWTYEVRSDIYSTYELVDSAEIVVSIDSTMGYESFARGVKTCFLSHRGVSINRPDISFGWPAKLSSNGLFWTDSSTLEEFLRVMNYLNAVSPEEWAKVYRQYSADLMEFDPGNTILIRLLKKLL